MLLYKDFISPSVKVEFIFNRNRSVNETQQEGERPLSIMEERERDFIKEVEEEKTTFCIRLLFQNETGW